MTKPSNATRADRPGDAAAGASSARARGANGEHATESESRTARGPQPSDECSAEDAAHRDGEQLARRAENDAGRGDEVRWRRLLSGGTPREILCRIVQGDPLGVRDRVAQRLHADAYLLDADRVHLRALARCARFAGRYQGRPDLSSWLDEIVGQAVEEVLREDAEPDLSRAASTSSAAFMALAVPLGLEPDAMRRACTAFNLAVAPERKAFFELVIHGRTLDDVARSSGESASEIARRARRALDLLLQIPTSKADETDGSNATPTEVECDVDTAHGDAAERRNAKSGVKRDATESNRGGRDTNEEARR